MNAALLPGETYSRMETVSIPNSIFGNYSIIAVTDVFNQVYEHIAENDNIRTSEVIIILFFNPMHAVLWGFIFPFQLTPVLYVR